MSNRINAFTVVLEEEIREEHAAELAAAIRQIRGVQSVSSHVADLADHIALVRARQELSTKLFEVLHPRDKS